MKFDKLKVVLIFVTVIAISFNSYALTPKSAGDEVVIVMCRPLVSQIKNIEEMYEKDIITLDRIKLIAVYHENEATDYSPAHEYVKSNNLSWVTFQTVKGEVKPENLFKRNKWTPQFKKIFKESDGIIFTGGADLPPRLYGRENNLLSEAITPVRSNYEVSFLFHLLGSSRNPGYKAFLENRPTYSVLGICLGFQTMNVACGGTMVQDIPSQVYGFKSMEQVLNAGPDMIHSWRYIRLMNPRDKGLPPAFHRIKLKKKGFFVKEWKMSKKDTPLVLSSHHQALKEMGKNLNVIATSMDGKIVEAIAHKKYKYVWGVQFHPEVYKLYRKGYYYQKAPGQPLNFNLRTYLMSNPPTMTFHKKVWDWFSQSLLK